MAGSKPGRDVAETLVSIVVPLHNSVSTLPELHVRISAAVAGYLHEIILVDDGSRDRTWEAALATAEVDPAVVAARMPAPVGQHQATLVGLRLARGDVVVTLDDDLQHPPSSIPDLIAALGDSGAARAVLAQPGTTRSHARWRNVVSSILNPLYSLILEKPMKLRLSAFRAMDRGVVDALIALRIPRPVISPMLFRVTKHVEGVAVTAGSADLRSRYTVKSLAAVGVGYLYGAEPFRLAVLGAVSLVTGAGVATSGVVLSTSAGGLLETSIASVATVVGAASAALGAVCLWAWNRLRRARLAPAPSVEPVEIIGFRDLAP